MRGAIHKPSHGVEDRKTVVQRVAAVVVVTAADVTVAALHAIVGAAALAMTMVAICGMKPLAAAATVTVLRYAVTMVCSGMRGEALDSRRGEGRTAQRSDHEWHEHGKEHRTLQWPNAVEITRRLCHHCRRCTACCTVGRGRTRSGGNANQGRRPDQLDGNGVMQVAK